MKIIAGLFLLATFGSAQAERFTILADDEDVVSKRLPGWELSGAGDEDVFFRHPGSLVRNGDIVDVWELGSYFSPKKNSNGREYRSDKSLHRYDCKKRTYQVITVTQYSDILGGGHPVDSFISDAPRHYYVTPDSIGESMLLASCKKTPAKKIDPPK